MKHFAATVAMIGLLAAFPAVAAKATVHRKPHLNAAQKKINKAHRKNVKAQKAAVRKAKARKPVKG